MTMVPDLDDLSITDTHYVYDRNVLFAGERFHPPNSRFEIPLPSSRYQLTFCKLIVDRTGHCPAIPEILCDLLLLVGLLHRVFSIADIMCDVGRSYEIIHRGRI